jgi:hypothetical protein
VPVLKARHRDIISEEGEVREGGTLLEERWINDLDND